MVSSTKVLVALCVCLMVSCSMGQLSERRLNYRAQQCRINRIESREPSEKIECEGGLIEVWDENDEQFQCGGIDAMRITIQPNSLSLPSYHPSSRLIYIQQGEGIMGVSFPGCPETYHSTFSSSRQQRGERGQFDEDQTDLHQKVHRFRCGDVLAIPNGASYWTYNDGNEDIVGVMVNDLSNQANQLDQNPREFFLAGGLERSSRGGKGGRHSHKQFQNILKAFDTELLAEAFNAPVELMKKIQQAHDRTLIIKADKEQMRILSPRFESESESRERDQQEDERRRKHMGLEVNGIEETICNMALRHNLDNEIDVYARHGGRLNIVNENKLPILKTLGMSIEKGRMLPNTIYTPNWFVNSHFVIYVTKGEAQVQVVGDNGELVMDDRVSEGEMYVIPQLFASTCKSGDNGFEYVAFLTTSTPIKSPIVGYTSVFRAMPLQVISNSYKISISEAQQLKYGRKHESVFLTPKRQSN